MQLELRIENTTRAWVLTPDRIYIIGTDPQCDIPLPPTQNVRAQHIKFSFNQSNNAWYFEDTIGKRGLIVNNQLAANGLISGVTKIALSNSFAIIATPEFATAPSYTAPVAPPSAPPNYAPPNSYNPPQPDMSGGLYSNPPVASGNLYSTPANNRASASIPRATLAELRSLSWGQYVKQQVKEQGDSFFKRLTVNYVLLTGFRITPWINKGIEGYIIPNFEGSIQTVVATIEQELGLLRQYEDTDCYVSELTDAHIVDSASQTFKKAELFPIARSKVHSRGDYRRFCITAYHRVKTYLLVEKYGPDVFVGMVTRFEPIPSSIPMLLWLILSIVFLLLSWVAKSMNIGDGNMMIFIGFTPLALWATIFMLVPQIMSMLRILPKKANGVLVRNVTIVLVSLCLLSLIGNQAFLLLFVFFFAAMLFAWTRSISSGIS